MATGSDGRPAGPGRSSGSGDRINSNEAWKASLGGSSKVSGVSVDLPKNVVAFTLLASRTSARVHDRGGSSNALGDQSSGRIKEKIFKFDKERIVLGSVVSADLPLTGDGISPIHAVVEVTRNSSTGTVEAIIFDLASDTGIFVNGKKVVTQRLSPKDEITLGKFHLKFTIEAVGQNDRLRQSGGKALFLNPQEDFTPLLLEDERDVVEIFDFRPSSQRALEVVMSWCGMILDVEHFVTEKQVTIGHTQRSDFAIPPILASSHYPVVTQARGGFVLNLDSQMKGVIQKGGRLRSLDEIRQETMSGPNGYEIPIENKDFAKISIGDIDFYFSFTSAPPRLKMKQFFERDPLFLRIFVISMLLTGGIVYSLFQMKVPQSVEPEKVPERIAAILYQPEKFLNPPPVPKPKPTSKPIQKEARKEEVKSPPPQPVVKPVTKIEVAPKPVDTHRPPPKEMEVRPVKKEVSSAPKAQPVAVKPARQNHPAPKAEAQEGEGAKAKGAAGSRGEKDAKLKSPNKVTEISRPSPKAGLKGAAGDSQVSEEGNVDLLKGAGGRIQNILGNSAAHLGEGSENLKGFGNFSTAGAGGLALSGSGHGGGGDAETTLGGLGKKGSGMGRIGTGKGAAGNGQGIIGSQVRVAIRSDGPEEAVVMGAIDRDAVAEAIFAHKDEFRLCYEREINAEHPSLSGQIGTSFVIGASGRVTHAGIESTSLNNPNAERCVLAVLKRIQFPIPRGGGVVEVHFPFKFNAVGR